MEQTRWFEEQVQPHEGALRSYLRRRVPSNADVDDVVQDSYIKILKARPAGAVKGFLFTIARNTALNLFRKRKIFSPTPFSELPESHIADEGRDGAASANAILENELLADVIAELPARCREILLLQFLDGLSPLEIAAKLGISESTVRTQLTRGVEKCTKQLRDRGVTP